MRHLNKRKLLKKHTLTNNTMALTQQELDRLKNLVQERQNPDLSKFSQIKPSAFNRVSDTISKQGENMYSAITGTGQYEGQSSVRRGVEATAQAFNAIPKVAIDLMPEPVRTGIGKVGEVVGKGFTALTDKIGDIPQLQQWTMDNPKAAKTLEEILGTTSAAGQIAGDITLASQGTRGIQATTGKGKEILTSVKNRIVPPKTPPTGGIGKTTVVEKAQDIISPIDKGVKTILTKSKTPKDVLQKKFQDYTTQAEKALADYSQETPLAMAGEKAQAALSKLQSQMTNIGKSKAAITDKLAGTRVNVRPFVKDIVNTVKERFNLQGTTKGFKEIPYKISKVSDKADIQLIDKVTKAISRAKTFKQLDDAVDYAQDLLYKRTGLTAVPVNTQVQGVLKNALKDVNNYLKKIGGKDYTQLNIKYANRINTFNKLNKALGQEGNKGAALMKQLFSPNSTATRKLFEAVKKFTGDDLVEEATLAKFVMENIGDFRQASLLEQVITGQATTKSGFIGIAAERILNKLKDPVGKAERLIKNSSSGIKKTLGSDIPNKQGGFIKIGDKVVKQIDEPTKRELLEAIKLLDNKPSKLSELDFDRLVEKFDLDVNSPISSIKKRITTILNKTK